MVTSLAVLHRQTDRQYVIPSLAGSQNLGQTMNGSVETACTEFVARRNGVKTDTETQQHHEQYKQYRTH